MEVDTVVLDAAAQARLYLNKEFFGLMTVLDSFGYALEGHEIDDLEHARRYRDTRTVLRRDSTGRETLIELWVRNHAESNNS